MTPTANDFEDRLLDALLERFDARAHSPAVAFVPTRRRSSVRRYAVPAGVLAATAAAVSLVVEVGGPIRANKAQTQAPTLALAAWTAQPTPAGQSQISGAEARCSSALRGDPSGPKAAPAPAGGPWSPALVDTRSDLTLALYTDGTQWVACLDGPSFIQVLPLDATGQAPVDGNSASLDKVSTRTVSGDVFSVALGRVGSAVTGVGLQRTDGSVVTATVGNGRYIAWWPGTVVVNAILITTATGTQSHLVVDPRLGQPSNHTVHLPLGEAQQHVPTTTTAP